MATPSDGNSPRSATRSAPRSGWAIVIAALVLSGCGRGEYEERLDATVQRQRTGGPLIGVERAEPPAAPAENAAPSETPSDEAQNATERGADAANASGQGVVGRAVLAPTDAFP